MVDKNIGRESSCTSGFLHTNRINDFTLIKQEILDSACQRKGKRIVNTATEQ